MLILRRIDWYGQIVVGVVALLCTPALYHFGLMAGLLVPGGWQLLSAACNTRAFVHSGLKTEIENYWAWTSIVLLTVILCIVLSLVLDSDVLLLVFGIGLPGSVILAVYYIIIYHRLLDGIHLKKEISGFTKSHR